MPDISSGLQLCPDAPMEDLHLYVRSVRKQLSVCRSVFSGQASWWFLPDEGQSSREWSQQVLYRRVCLFQMCLHEQMSDEQHRLHRRAGFHTYQQVLLLRYSLLHNELHMLQNGQPLCSPFQRKLRRRDDPEKVEKEWKIMRKTAWNFCCKKSSKQTLPFDY